MSVLRGATGRKRRAEVEIDEGDDVTVVAEPELVGVEGECVDGDGDGSGEGDGNEEDGWSEEAEVEDEEPEDMLTTRTPTGETDEWANEIEYVVEAIEAVRWRRGVPFYLVQWEGLPVKAQTWEPTESFKGSGASALAVFIDKRVRLDIFCELRELVRCV